MHTILALMFLIHVFNCYYNIKVVTIASKMEEFFVYRVINDYSYTSSKRWLH